MRVVDRRWSAAFAQYWTSATVSYLGDGIRFVAVPLLAVALSSSPVEVAGVAAAGSLPWLLFGLPAGVVVDRIDRLRTMRSLQLARAVVMFATVYSVVAHAVSIPLLAVLIFLLSAIEVVYDIASHAVLPSLVPQGDLQWANGRLIIAETAVFEFVGPAAGGALFALAPALPLAVDAVTFAASGVLLAQIVRRTPPRAREGKPSTSPAAELREGLRWFWGQRLLRALTVVATYGNFAAGAFYALFVLFCASVLHVGPVGYGLLIGASAAGALVGGLAADRIGSPAARRRTIALTGPSDCLCLILIALVPWWPVTTVLLVVFGLIVTVHNVLSVSLRQAITPDEIIGRMMSVHRFLSWGALPVGAIVGGVVADHLGLRLGIGLTAAAAGVAGCFALLPLPRADRAQFAYAS